MIDVVSRWLDELQRMPPASMARRLLLATLIGVGAAMTGMGSMLVQMMGPVPFKLLPDARPVVFFLGGFLPGLYAAGGAAHRRKLALWSLVALIVGFHLEEASVHWIGPFPGSITGTRIGLVGTAGSLLALVSLLALHIEVERVKLREDLARRGAAQERLDAAVSSLAGLGARKVLAIGAGVAALGVLLRGVEAVAGDDATGGTYALFVGGGLLLALAIVLLRLVPRAQEAG